MNWYIDAWKNYFTFTGRARRVKQQFFCKS